MSVYSHIAIINSSCHIERRRNELNMNYKGFSTMLEMTEKFLFYVIMTLKGYTIFIINNASFKINLSNNRVIQRSKNLRI
jgi:hypothetical protein